MHKILFARSTDVVTWSEGGRKESTWMREKMGKVKLNKEERRRIFFPWCLAGKLSGRVPRST